MVNEWPVYCRCGKQLGVLVFDVKCRGHIRAVLLGRFYEWCEVRYGQN